MVYDINTEDQEGRRRLLKTMKTCRKYLTHVQRSVFEGDLTEGQLALLKKEVAGIVDKSKDFLIVYNLPDGSKLRRDIVTDTPDPTSNFL